MSRTVAAADRVRLDELMNIYRYVREYYLKGRCAGGAASAVVTWQARRYVVKQSEVVRRFRSRG